MKPKHTPGPWTLGISTRGPKFDEYDRVNSQNSGICLLDQHPGGITEANARLIAATPELILGLQESLNEIGYLIEASYEHGFGGTKRSLELLERMQTLGAKATGGAR